MSFHFTIGLRAFGRAPRQTVGMFEGFTESMVAADGLELFVRQGGAGPVVLLLHGHPRTSATWHRVAPQLVSRGLTVVCADLPGYGRSGKPTPTADHAPHSKRAGAGHLVAAMRALGHDRFAVVGHDRGSYYALRLALDHSQCVSRLALLDCLSISEHLDRASARFATACGTGSSSPSRTCPNGSSPLTLTPGTAATRRSWARTTTTNGMPRCTTPPWSAACWRTTGPA